VSATRAALQRGAEVRNACPACGGAAPAWSAIDGLEYMRCSDCATVFLRDMAPPAVWAGLLADASRQRMLPGTLHTSIAQSRAENVYEPKLDWIRNTLRLQGLARPALVEVTTAPSPFTRLLQSSSLFEEMRSIEESSLMGVSAAGFLGKAADAAVLLESLDRSREPRELLRGVHGILRGGGLLFITALVSSGFDMMVLGAGNTYLYPPDRANCFSLAGLERLLIREGFNPLELSTPGVLDAQIVAAHLSRDPLLKLSAFERQVVMADPETQTAFQSFLQQNRMSSFARIVARKAA
jgi:hypothetical protein